jgi:hypothetical protein
VEGTSIAVITGMEAAADAIAVVVTVTADVPRRERTDATSKRFSQSHKTGLTTLTMFIGRQLQCF